MKIKNTRFIPLSVLMLAGACTLLPTQAPPSAPPSNETSELSSCRNDGPRLPLSGLCSDVAMKTLDIVNGSTSVLPEGCVWDVQETLFANDLLIYLAAKCGDITSQLRYSAGARQAKFTIRYIRQHRLDYSY